ncbi:MAG: hypothetical protein J6M93_02760 [Succinivibrio sp.]|nr:hypothetical protein [Succinivibrio sp.]
MNSEDLVLAIAGGFVLGAVVAYIIVACMASGLKSVKPRNEADVYMVDNSLNFDDKTDIYRGTRIERQLKPQNDKK